MKRLNPAEGALDFWSEFTKPTPYRWPGLIGAAAISFSLFYFFTQERVLIPPAPPTVTYIPSFAPDRSDNEIMASNIENQRIKDERTKLKAERAERIKDMYRTLGRATGMDVDRIEREAAEADAREAAAQDALMNSRSGNGLQPVPATDP